MRTEFKEILEAECTGVLNTQDVENKKNREVRDQRLPSVELSGG